uniref:G-protein coupled receptors family 1 profile domain-containing protein n=1 Tax=Catagonus wagneri TaxID=51154 RepID=A0A8C3WN34_9CETA
MAGLKDVKHFQPCTRCSRQAPGEDLHQGNPRSEMNSSVEDLGVGSCSPWDDPARFIVVPAAYALALGLGLPANVAALAVFARSGRRLGQALRLYLLNLALADVLFTLTLPLWPPAARPGLPTTCPPTRPWPSPRSSACAAAARCAGPGPGRPHARRCAAEAQRALPAPPPGWRAWPVRRPRWPPRTRCAPDPAAPLAAWSAAGRARA